jgi:hypothetical protein
MEWPVVARSVPYNRQEFADTPSLRKRNSPVRVAREKGIVRDRLRLKDATHMLANIAVPSAMA